MLEQVTRPLRCAMVHEADRYSARESGYLKRRATQGERKCLLL